MAEVLLVSKPVAPPWNDSSKNLVRDLATHLERHRGHVLSHAGVGDSLGPSIVETVYPSKPSGFAPGLMQNLPVLKRLVAGPKLDLWHFFFAPNPRTSNISRRVSGWRNMRTLQTVCSEPRADLDPRPLLFADRVIVLSKRTEKRLIEALVPRERVVRISPSVPALELRSAEQRRETRKQFGIPEGVPLITYPGDFEFGTGAELALEAFSRIPQTLGAHFAFACRVKTERALSVAERLKANVEALGLTSRVSFVGEIRNIYDFLAASDVVTLPATTTYAKMDLPLVLLEAMLLERPVVVTYGTAMEELGEAGAVVCGADQEALTAELTKLVEDRQAALTLGRQGRTQVLAEFSAQKMAQAYERVYDELL